MASSLKYTIIKSEKQYDEYCDILEELVFKEDESYNDEIELVTLLIEKWDDENYSTSEIDPVQLLKSIMKDNGLKAKDLCKILSLSKGTVSKILNYQTGISKEAVRKLSKHFKLKQEAFNRPYQLKEPKRKQY